MLVEGVRGDLAGDERPVADGVDDGVPPTKPGRDDPAHELGVAPSIPESMTATLTGTSVGHLQVDQARSGPGTTARG